MRLEISSRSLRRRVVERFAGSSRWSRFHVFGRLMSWPFARTLAEVPPSGLIGSIGCGRGCFEIAMLLDAPNRRVVATDIDAGKIEVAQRAAAGLFAEFYCGDFFALLEERGLGCDAIVISDVLYLLEPSEQRQMLDAARRALVPGGKLVIKETGTSPSWKSAFTRFQEFLSCRIVRITRNAKGAVGFRSGTDWVECLHSLGYVDVALHHVHRHYPYPHILITGHTPGVCSQEKCPARTD